MTFLTSFLFDELSVLVSLWLDWSFLSGVITVNPGDYLYLTAESAEIAETICQNSDVGHSLV